MESCQEEARWKKEKKKRKERRKARGKKKKDNEVIRGIIAGVPKEADTVGGGVTRNTVSAAQSTTAGEDSLKKSELGVGRKDELKRIDQSLKQKWVCHQIEEYFGEGEVTDWYEDDEMVRQWEKTSKEEEKIAKEKMERESLQVEGVRSSRCAEGARASSISGVNQRTEAKGEEET